MLKSIELDMSGTHRSIHNPILKTSKTSKTHVTALGQKELFAVDFPCAEPL